MTGAGKWRVEPGRSDGAFAVVYDSRRRLVANFARTDEAIQVVAAMNAREQAESKTIYTQAEFDECGEIGERDGYERAVQDIDVLTGGDGEYKVSIDLISGQAVCVDVEAMKARIVDRFAPPAPIDAVAVVTQQQAALQYIHECFEAARVEGLTDRMNEPYDEAVRIAEDCRDRSIWGLVERRLLPAGAKAFEMLDADEIFRALTDPASRQPNLEVGSLVPLEPAEATHATSRGPHVTGRESCGDSSERRQPEGDRRCTTKSTSTDTGAGDDRSSAPAPLTHAQLDEMQARVGIYGRVDGGFRASMPSKDYADLLAVARACPAPEQWDVIERGLQDITSKRWDAEAALALVAELRGKTKGRE